MTLFDIISRYPHGEEMVTSLLPHIVQRLDVYVTRHGNLLGHIIDQGRETNDFQTEDSNASGQILARLFEHLTPPYYRFDSRKSLEHCTNQLLEMLLTGLMTKNKTNSEKYQGHAIRRTK